jgi:signal transduction histidine kinase
MHRVRIAILLMFVTNLSLAQPVLRLDSAFRQSSLVGYLSRLDTARAIPPPQLAAYWPQFRPVAEAVVGYGADQRHHYLLLTLRNATDVPKRLVLTLEQLFFDTIAVYSYVPGGRLEALRQSGWQVPLLHRPLPYPLHNLPVEIPARATRHVVLHTKVNPSQRVSKALLTLYDEAVFSVAMTRELLIQGGLYGCLLLAVLLGLLLAVYTRQWLYILYSLYVITQAAYALTINGLFAYVPTMPGWVATPIFGYLMVLASVALQGHFYLRFLRVAEWADRWLSGFANATVWGVTGLVLLGLFIPDSLLVRKGANLLTGTYLLGMFTCLGVGVWHKRSGAIWMLAALAPVLLLLTYYMLGGWLLPLYMPAYTMPFVSPVLLTEVIVLGSGLAYRFNEDRRMALLRLNQVEQETTRRVMQAQEEERQQLAANLHDDLGGTLAALRGELSRTHEADPELATAIGLTELAVNDLRLISHHLMPTAFVQKGLLQVLEEAVELANRTSPSRPVRLVSFGQEHRLAPERELNTYRVVRELLSNALKHAEATAITVQLIYYDLFLYASVEDDGKGIARQKQPQGIGLKNIQLRADFLHATLTTESGPSGTLVAIEVPYEE